MLAGRKPGDFFVLAHQLYRRAALVSLLPRVDPDQLRLCWSKGHGIWQLGRVGDLADRGPRVRLPGQFKKRLGEGVQAAVHAQWAMGSGMLEQWLPSPMKLPQVVRGGLVQQIRSLDRLNGQRRQQAAFPRQELSVDLP